MTTGFGSYVKVTLVSPVHYLCRGSKPEPLMETE